MEFRCKRYRICGVVKENETIYVVKRRFFGLWVRQWIPSSFFDFPVNWQLAESFFYTLDDAVDALYGYLHLRHRDTDFSLSFKDVEGQG